jgi:hypothetical protein
LLAAPRASPTVARRSHLNDATGSFTMIANRVWMIDPHSGGRPIPSSLQHAIRSRIQEHAHANYGNRFDRLAIDFKKQFCHLAFYRPIPPISYKPFRMTFEEYVEHIKTDPIKMCRLRFFDIDRWSCAFFTYSTEVYKPCIFPSGEWFGTVEEGFDIGATHFE